MRVKTLFSLVNYKRIVIEIAEIFVIIPLADLFLLAFVNFGKKVYPLTPASELAPSNHCFVGIVIPYFAQLNYFLFYSTNFLRGEDTEQINNSRQRHYLFTI